MCATIRSCSSCTQWIPYATNRWVASDSIETCTYRIKRASCHRRPSPLRLPTETGWEENYRDRAREDFEDLVKEIEIERAYSLEFVYQSQVTETPKGHQEDGLSIGLDVTNPMAANVAGWRIEAY
jgi:hypothetical protein